ncbi:hypothetical protein NDU88_006729 [Pleurodeles waltl]|uniref:Uncharacterized protein n=1 Tax=Pleurodeles waltl TaxID=8319 RepID=A0AAV7WBH1_PLEWA|nr:hypothetical protein NDU88_006729 [Pleurodeles waltl]
MESGSASKEYHATCSLHISCLRHPGAVLTVVIAAPVFGVPGVLADTPASRRTCSSGSLASWFFVEYRKGGRYIVFRLSVGGDRCGVCCYRSGGQSVKVAVYDGGFRRGHDPIFFTAGLLAVLPPL